MRRRSRRVPAEDGFTLIEVLLTLAIMGLAMVAILGAMGTTIIGSTVHRRQADAGAVLLSAVERLKETSYDTSCITPPQAYLDAVRSVRMPSGWKPTTAVTIQAMTYWDPLTSTFGASCIDDTSADAVSFMQSITVEVSTPDGGATPTLTVFKRG